MVRFVLGVSVEGPARSRQCMTPQYKETWSFCRAGQGLSGIGFASVKMG